MLATALIGAAGWGWIDRERRRREAAQRSAVDAALADASTETRACPSRRREPIPWVEAIEAARRAESLLGGGAAGSEQRERVQAFLADLVRERDAAEAVEKDRRIVERLAAILNDLGVHNDDAKADAEYAAAFRAYGVDLDELDPTTAGQALAASPAAANLASALDQWAFLRRGRILRDPSGAERLVAVARVADPDPWRNRLRDTLGRMEGGPSRRLDDAWSGSPRPPTSANCRWRASPGWPPLSHFLDGESRRLASSAVPRRRIATTSGSMPISDGI